MKLRYFIVGLIIFYQSVLGVAAQDGCEITLNMAIDEFNTGHFYGVPALLSPCIDKGQNREWRQRAYLLLTQTYLLLDDPIAAKASYLKVLEANPEYVPNPQLDPMDLVYFSSKFTASPLFSAFAYTGSNISQTKVLLDTEVETSPGGNTINKKYLIRPGFQVGAGIEWHYDDNLSATVELNYFQSAYKKETTNIFQRDKLEVIDKQNWFRLPLAIKFSDNTGKYRPYGYVGFSLDYMISDKAIITNVNNYVESNRTTITESPDQDFISRRNRFNQSIFFGGGVKYKLGLNYAFIDVRYSVGMKNIVNPETIYYDYKNGDQTSTSFLDNGDPTFSRAHVDDLFRMNNVILSIGYVRPLYKPRELKRAKTKSILRRIKKQDDKG